jgi:WhiB family redox-sensing transcriptional regulator
MTATHVTGHDLGDGVPLELRQWWAGLYHPTRQLTTDQQHELRDLLDRGWQQNALCAQSHPDAWFPEHDAALASHARAVCAHCPIQRPCLAAALLHSEQGIWAGTTERDRRVLYALLKAGTRVADVLELAQGTDRQDEIGLQGAA